ncbi:MAG: transposase [Pseudonocardiaceae bacterium]
MTPIRQLDARQIHTENRGPPRPADREGHPEHNRLAGPLRAARRCEGTIRQGVAVTGMRRARYRGLSKTRLEHVYSAVALNLIRLDAYWNGHALDRTRTSHLARLDLALAA